MITLDIGSWAETAVGGSMVLALPVALVAGLVSFFSPCVVPLLPGYLSYATGLGAAEVIEGPKHRSRMLLGTAGFVLGFAVIFVITGVVGVVIIILGLIFAGLLPIGQRDLRSTRVPAVGVAAAPLLGMVFALGWTRCITTTMGVVVNLGCNEGTALRGGLLGFVYALGLGIPFVLAGLAFSRMSRAVGFIRDHQQMIMRVGGVLLVAVGMLLLTGAWDWLTSLLRQWASSFETAI